MIAALAFGCEEGDEGQVMDSADVCLRAPVVTDPAAPVGRATRLFASTANACAVFENGSMRCWGDNTYGQLGFGELWTYGTAHITEGLPPVDRVAIGARHMCALTADGCVWCWGSNLYGQLGMAEVGGSALPVQLRGTSRVVDIGAYSLASYALRDDGRVEWWGLRDPVTSAKTPTTWIDGTSYTSIGVGMESACGLRSDGIVECWGSNDYGQLGTPEEGYHEQPVTVAALTDVVQIAVTALAACAVRADKSVWCWGSNAGGKLGDGTTMHRSTPQKVPLADVEQVDISGHTCAITSQGRLFCWGSNEYKQIGNGAVGDVILTPWEIVGIEGARAVATGWASTCVLMGDHDVRCWGYNKQGELGDGTGENSSTPVQVVWNLPP